MSATRWDNDVDRENNRNFDQPYYKKFKDFRKLFGLSPNGMRLYEHKGIISLPRNSENNYRVATLSDAVRMCKAFELSHCGISLDDVKGLVTTDDVNQELTEYGRLEEDLSHQIIDLLEKRSRVERMERRLLDYERDPLNCQIVCDRSIYFCNLHSQDIEITDFFDDASAWWKASPFVTAGLIVSLDQTHQGIDAMHGPTVSESDAVRLNLPLTNAIHFCEKGCKYLRAFVTFPMEELPDAKTYEHAFTYAQREGLTLNADKVLHILMRCHNDNGISMRTDEVLIPIAQG